MVLDITELELSGLVFDGDQPVFKRDRHNDAKNRDANYDSDYDSKTFIYDCFHDPELNNVTLLCPKLLNFRSILDDLRIKIDGLLVQPTKIESLSRCAVITLPCLETDPRVVTLSHPLFGANLAIGRSYLAQFAGKNAIFTISQNNRLEWLQDWLTHYVKEHKTNALVLSENNSTKYSSQELINAISQVPGIETAVIIQARYPFGPADKDSYGALFLQRALAELCRRRFLGRARAVVSADIDELFHSNDGTSIYDAAVASETGYIRADAEWVYADPNSDGGQLRHKDHRFISADGKPKSNRKWCVVPQGPQNGQQWRTHFINRRNDPVDPNFKMWHFRQISNSWKHDRSDIGEITLVANPELQQSMDSVFGTTTAKSPAIVKPSADQSALIITSMKNEGPFILEWIAYHRVIGFDKFLVYTNDCSDGTDAILDRLQNLGIVEHRRNKVLRRGPQKSALKDAIAQPISQQASWILVSDIDEFLNIKAGDGHLQDLLKAVPNSDAIPVTWRLFSNDDRVEFDGNLVIQSYSDAQSDLKSGGLRKRFVKTLFKPHADIERFGTHGPILSDDNLANFQWISPNGVRITDPKEMTRRQTDFSYDVAQFNHYATRSVDEYLVKKERGRVNHFKQVMELDYWVKMCQGGEADKTIHRHIDATRSEIDRLLKDKVLSDLHDASVNWYRAKIKELRANPKYEDMRNEILSL